MKKLIAGIAMLLLAVLAFGQLGTVSVKTADYAVVPADHGSIIIMNSASARTVYLPGPSPAQIGMTITIQKRGAGNVTIQAAAADYVADSGVGQYIRNTTATETYASITLVYAQANRWQIQAASGTWSTDTSTMLFGADTKAQIDTKAPIASPTFTGTINGFALSNPGGNRNIVLGFAAPAAWTTSTDNSVAIGSGALKANTTGDNNVAIGTDAMMTATDSASNVAIGDSTLYRLTTGQSNTAVGSGAGFSITTGGTNIAVGSNAVSSLTTGMYNTGIGESAYGGTTGDYNLAIGYQAMANATGPSNNISLGKRSLRYLTTGTYNIVIGDGAGSHYANAPLTDDNGILIGNSADRSVASANKLTNYIGIGYGTLVDKSNQVKIGNSSIVETVTYGAPINSGTPQTLTGAGAVNLTTFITWIVTTGADALTLADGQEGQEKIITMKTDGGDGTLTPAHAAGFTTIAFNDVGDTVRLVFTNGTWCVLGYFGTTIS